MDREFDIDSLVGQMDFESNKFNNINGLMLTNREVEVLDRYNINYKNCTTLKEIIFQIEDLIQDIYLLLLQKDDDLIINLYNKGEIGFYLLKVARNQLLSVNSKYYYTYIKLAANSDEITKAANTITTED